MSVVDGLAFSDEKNEYIVGSLEPILSELVSDILTEMPDPPLDFIIAWLRKRHGVTKSNRASVFQKNAMLKQELVQITGALQEASSAMGREAAEDGEEPEEEDDDDECDEIPEFFKKSEASMGKARASVSAEAYGNWNQKKEFVPPNIPKSDEQKARLSSTLLKSFMFAALANADLETIILAMKEMNFEVGAKVITEGDNGDFLFVIEKGVLECIKNINGADTVVKSVVAGDVFGELALLYNCPRAASVVAKETCVCWQLDRETFNHVVKDAAAKQRNKYDSFLQQVALISSIDAYERSQIADALVPETFRKGSVIVKQDDAGDKFYIVEEGSLYATKTLEDGSDKRVMDYKSGDYFGELALLKNQPRAASVVVASDSAIVLSMSRVSFNRVLGPLQHILSRQITAYKN